eukprot:snap_masked-scaffold_10-processed-gene-13.38-mRNA-1 protein AED:1.00 eAED:1.00 QI:0/0/0/0/1/1/2/0/420
MNKIKVIKEKKKNGKSRSMIGFCFLVVVLVFAVLLFEDVGLASLTEDGRLQWLLTVESTDENSTSLYKTKNFVSKLERFKIHEKYISLLNASSLKAWPKKVLQCNLIYVKIPKCASSTVGGITRRIADQNENERRFYGVRSHANKTEVLANPERCRVLANHQPHPNVLPQVLEKNLRRNTFLFTFVRNPEERILSQLFHFGLARTGKEFSDRTAIKYIENMFRPEYIIRYMSLIDCRRRFWFQKYEEKRVSCLEKTLMGYDFIGLVERFDESLVVLKILLDLNFGDILYVSKAKKSGFDDKGVQFIPKETTESFDSYMRRKINNLGEFMDEILYFLVEYKLWVTIQHIGDDTFSKELIKFRQIRTAAEKFCKGRVITPYDTEGNFQFGSLEDCYWNDNGCGIQCMNEFIETNEYMNTVRS